MNRYERNIQLLGLEAQKKITKAKVLVAGAGGLGSTVIVNLASLGIGTLGIIDKDIIEPSNFNRQYIHLPENTGKSKSKSAFEWVKSYNPDISVKFFNINLDKNNYKKISEEFDIIIDCFDSYKSKFLLNYIAIQTNKILVLGGVSGFCGQVVTVIPHKTACLRCLLPEADENENINQGIVSPVVSTIASLQSMEVLKLIIGQGDVLTNQILTFNALKTEFRKITFERNKNCPVCG